MGPVDYALPHPLRLFYLMPKKADHLKKSRTVNHEIFFPSSSICFLCISFICTLKKLHGSLTVCLSGAEGD